MFVFAPLDEQQLEWAKALLSVSRAWTGGVLTEQAGPELAA